MEKLLYDEMAENLDRLIQENVIQGKKLFLFGHCNATEELADLLFCKGFRVTAILDNNIAKYGKQYRGIMVRPPKVILRETEGQTLVCIAARAYEAMAEQLKRLGYKGLVRKLVDYNSYAEYSLSADTIMRKQQRVENGIRFLRQLGQKYPGCFKILCPFSALGDIYFMMSYLPYFIQRRGIKKSVIGVIGNSCGQVVRLFGDYEAEVFTQKEMDETVQAALYMGDADTFIPHQDRPYIVNLSRALYIRKIPLEQIYCCGIFGLPPSTKPYNPINWCEYRGSCQIERGRSVIISPYAKSVTSLKREIWEQIINDFQSKGYSCYTNVTGEEKPLPGTQPISPSIFEMKSAVERAGTFIGIRSGLCDVLREAACRKIALYPDYNYCDTKWKAIDIYAIEGWENIVAGEGFEWKKN